MVQLLASRNIDNPIARMHSLDFMYRWKPFRQGEWKSYLLGGEAMFSDPVVSPSNASIVRRPKGASVFTQWQLDRRKYAGARFDYTTTLQDPTLQRKSVTPTSRITSASSPIPA
jgi:hypothetical protein